MIAHDNFSLLLSSLPRAVKMCEWCLWCGRLGGSFILSSSLLLIIIIIIAIYAYIWIWIMNVYGAYAYAIRPHQFIDYYTHTSIYIYTIIPHVNSSDLPMIMMVPSAATSAVDAAKMGCYCLLLNGNKKRTERGRAKDTWDEWEKRTLFNQWCIFSHFATSALFHVCHNI